MGFFDKLKNGLGKTRNSFGDKINSVFSNFRKVDEELLEELEEILIMSDIGVDTSVEIIGRLRNRIKKEKGLSWIDCVGQKGHTLSSSKGLEEETN